MDMSDKTVAVLVEVDEKIFPDGDELSFNACNLVGNKLVEQLKSDGYKTPDWVTGGFEEDWSICFQASANNINYEFTIAFFPDESDTSVLVKYGIKKGFLASLLKKNNGTKKTGAIHKSMAIFCASFDSYKQLTQVQLNGTA